MITEKALKASESTKKTVYAVDKKLTKHKIKHDPIDYNIFLYGASGYHILTEYCTIEVYREKIVVNEKQVEDVNEMIFEVLKVEG